MNISGYTWGINAVKKLLPYEAAIKSMLLLADEVFVAYDPRYDLPETFTQIDERVKVVPREFDVTDIRAVGPILTDVRQRCNGDWLIWLDLDETIHERDVDNILTLIQYAEAHGHTSLELGFYQYISKKYTFADLIQWCTRPKIMRNFKEVSHGIDLRHLQQREDGTPYLSGGDGIDFVKDGQVFAYRPLPYRDFPLMRKLRDKTVTCEDVIRSTDFFPYIYHYSRYSMQRKAKMGQGDRLGFWVRAHDNYDVEQWAKDLESPVIMEHQKEESPGINLVGEFEPAHSQYVMEWVETMDGFMGGL